MKKSLIGLVLCSVVVSGCGSGDSNTDKTSSAEVTRFKLYDTVWQVMLPTDWTLQQPPMTGTVLIALNQDQNLIMAEKANLSADTKSGIMAENETRFFQIEMLNETDSSWVFKGKITAGDPVRVFHQRILPIPSTPNYLIGICSYDFWEERAEVCTAILANWVQEVPTND